MERVTTVHPYSEIPHKYIQYNPCRDFSHISRYRGLRQVVHNTEYPDERMITLETPNKFVSTETPIIWHEVEGDEVNRLDLISQKYLGSPHYSWVISYFNGIEDGFSCSLGQSLMIPSNVSSLMRRGEILQNVSPLTLNLGSE